MIISSPIATLATYQQQPQTENVSNDPEKVKLKSACQEFEAVMTSLIMKEGLKSAQEMGKMTDGSDDDSDKGSSMYKEIANEQMAHFIGKQGLMGIADLLYNQVAPKLDAIKKPANMQGGK
jgi:Rod binding domain-containing protein